MNVIIQIPCLNEAETLPDTLAQIPRSIDGVNSVEILVIDDGSTDETDRVAHEHGVEHVVRHKRRLGLARAYQTGIHTALMLGADIIVNTDGDGQYPGKDIPRLVAPIVKGRADMVIADRQVSGVAHFSPIKRRLQKLGSSVVRRMSQTAVPDATSGFRALSREAALRLDVASRYTYTLETIVRAGRMNLAIESIPIQPNPPTRPSRLFHSMMGYIWRSIATLVRLYILFQPMKFFATISALFMAGGAGIGLRFLYYYFAGEGSGKIQSLILAAILLIIGFNVFVIGILSANLAANRELMEDCLYRLKRIETPQNAHDQRQS
ncbi:MAG: glycosyltransferase family 2 protein [Deltaproteobacteria bacterium]|nr:glycosyltransferase family 2 protein [Deltaproteobacteria bacterium]